MRLSPLLEDVGRVAVHIEPRQRVGKRGSMGQTSYSTRRHFRRDETRCEVDNLTEPLDVTPGNGQHAEMDAIGVRLPGSSVAGSSCQRTERLQQRPDEHGVREIGRS
jgi:hypothetical protein